MLSRITVDTAPTQVGKAPAQASLPASPRQSPNGWAATLDSRTEWPTHRVRWCLSLLQTESRNTAR